MLQIIACDPKWVAFPVAQWIAAFQKPGRGIMDDDLAPIVNELLRHFPAPGGQTHREVPVIVKHSKLIAEHRHPEHVIIYYPVGHPAKLLTEYGDYSPIENTAVYMPPNTLHSVERNTTKLPRLSLALRWKTT